MAYETGSATSPTDLLQKLVTWLVARGWTQNMSQADGNGWRAHLVKSGLYINLRSNIGSGTNIWGTAPLWTATNYDGVGCYTGTGYNAGSAWHSQAGGPIASGQTYTLGAWMQTPAGAILAYHFFDDGADNILVVVERTAGIFGYLGWGPSIVKAGTWTGGPYFVGTWSSTFGASTSQPGSSGTTCGCPGSHEDGQGTTAAFVRADVDAFTGKYVGIGDNNTPQNGYTGKIGASSIQTAPSSQTPSNDIPQCLAAFLARQTSAMNSQANLVPVRWFAQRDGGAGHSLLGRLPNIFATNATTKGFASGQEVTIGGDTYKIFPNFAVKKVS